MNRTPNGRYGEARDLAFCHCCLMGWDFAEETVRVLTSGLPPSPPEPSPGLTFAAACHQGDRFGAVLFLRLWRNGQWDSDTAITERSEDGWAYPSACGGGGWLNPYERPAAGWDGEPIALLGANRIGSEQRTASSTEQPPSRDSQLPMWPRSTIG